MKKLFLTLSGLFASVPGLVVIFRGIGTPPGYSTLFGGIIEALGAASFLILLVNKDKIKSAPSGRITKAAILLCAGFVLSIVLYLMLYNFCVVGNPIRHYVYYPLWTSGEVAGMIGDAGGRVQALEENGFTAVYRAISEMPNYPLAIGVTTFVLILLYQAIFTTLCLAFGLLGFHKIEYLMTSTPGNGEAGDAANAAANSSTLRAPRAQGALGAGGARLTVGVSEILPGAGGEEKAGSGEMAKLNSAGSDSEFTVFISYAHKDNENSDPSKRWLDRLLEYLQPLVAQDQVSAKSDVDVETGALWHESIQTQIHNAKVAVLLISPAFLASKYIRNSELPALLVKAMQKGVTVLPIILRHSLFSETRFKYPDPVSGPHEASLSIFQSANPPGRPLNAMNEDEQDEVLLSIAQRILKIARSGRSD